jgi:hypothetical protein
MQRALAGWILTATALCSVSCGDSAESSNLPMSYRERWNEVTTIELEIQSAVLKQVRACMRSAGFSYVPRKVDEKKVPIQIPIAPPLTDYGAVRRWRILREHVKSDPNNSIRNSSFDEQERACFVKEREDVQKRFPTYSKQFRSLIDDREQFTTRLASDSGFRGLERQWSMCMAKAGFAFTSLGAPAEFFYEEASKAEGRAIHEKRDPFAELEAVLSLEQEAALADRTCRKPLLTSLLKTVELEDTANLEVFATG